MTETEQLQAPTSLVISPNLQALLEFDNRLRTPNESDGPPAKESPGFVQPTQPPSWVDQGVPTVSLPPPRRKKSVVTSVPESPRATFESASMVASPTNGLPPLGEISGDIEFSRPEDALVGKRWSTNPYLNSPPSPPRYFYPRLDGEEERADQHQPSPFYTLEKSRSMKWPDMQRSFSGPSPVEHKGQLASGRYFTSLVRNVGSRPKEKGMFFCLYPRFKQRP